MARAYCSQLSADMGWTKAMSSSTVQLSSRSISICVISVTSVLRRVHLDQLRDCLAVSSLLMIAWRSFSGSFLRAPLLSQLLCSMLLVIGNSCCKRHGTRYTDVGQGDNQRLSFFWRCDMAHNAPFIPGVGEIRNGKVFLLRAGNIFSANLFEIRSANSTSNGTAAFNADNSFAVFSGWS